MAHLRLFGPARDAAGVAVADVPGQTVSEILAAANERYGTTFSDVLARSNVWLNGDVAPPDAPVTDDDEVAVLPPVSGG